MLEDDIRRNLLHPNVHFQSQGFSALLSALQSEVDVKRRRSLRSLLFDCLRAQSPSLAVVGWAASAIEELYLKDPSELINEVLSCLGGEKEKDAGSRRKPLQLCLSLIFKAVGPTQLGRCAYSFTTPLLPLTHPFIIITRIFYLLPSPDDCLLLVPHLITLPATSLIPIAAKLILTPTRALPPLPNLRGKSALVAG